MALACNNLQSGSSSRMRWKYDVFVSFRGDIRNNFTNHLFGALHNKNIVTFRDDTKLKKGEHILPELLQAIEGSQILIVIFSTNYASSTWCLKELAKIADCIQVPGQSVLPIFYDVIPSEVRKQSGDYEKAFQEHEEKSKATLEEVQRWRGALKQVANISGWDLRDKPQYPEIENIIKEVTRLLRGKSSNLPMDIVGMHSQVEDVENHMKLDSDDVRDCNQLDKLDLKRECLGTGSRIIIISRNEHILNEHGVDEVYRVRLLNRKDALQLFCRKAFKSEDVKSGYEHLTYEVLKYANGKPARSLHMNGGFSSFRQGGYSGFWPPLTGEEALWRELEKEVIRREILRRMELEEEVRRELGISTQSHIGAPQPQLILPPTEINPFPEISYMDKVIVLDKPDPKLFNAKRKAATLIEPSTLDFKKKLKEEWSCALCEIKATSESCLKAHLNGKKHKIKEAKQNKKICQSNISSEKNKCDCHKIRG